MVCAVPRNLSISIYFIIRKPVPINTHIKKKIAFDQIECERKSKLLFSSILICNEIAIRARNLYWISHLICIQLILLLIFLCIAEASHKFSQSCSRRIQCVHEEREKKKERRKCQRKHGYYVNRTVNAHIFKRPKFTRHGGTSERTDARYAEKVQADRAGAKWKTAFLKMKLRAGLFQ